MKEKYRQKLFDVGPCFDDCILYHIIRRGRISGQTQGKGPHCRQVFNQLDHTCLSVWPKMTADVDFADHLTEAAADNVSTALPTRKLFPLYIEAPLTALAEGTAMVIRYEVTGRITGILLAVRIIFEPCPVAMLINFVFRLRSRCGYSAFDDM